MTRKDLEILFAKTDSSSFSKFVAELRKTKNNREVTDFELQSMLCSLADSMVDECRASAMRPGGLDERQKSMLNVCARTLACSLLVLYDTRSWKELSERLLLFLELSSYVLKSRSIDLCGSAVEAACYHVARLGFTFTHIEKAASTESLAYNVVSGLLFNHNEPFDAVRFNGKGSVILSGGELEISSAALHEQTSDAFGVCGGKVFVSTRNSRDERLKASDVSNMEALTKFSSTFLLVQQDQTKSRMRPARRKLAVGEKYAIRCTGINENGMVACDPVGIETEAKCHILEEELVKGIFTSRLQEYILRDDCILDAKLVSMDGGMVFSIKDSYESFAKMAAHKDHKACSAAPARLIGFFRRDDPDKARSIWMSSNGYGGICTEVDGLEIGDERQMEVMNIKGGLGSTFINVKPASVYSKVIEGSAFDPDNVLLDYVTTYQAALEHEQPKEEKGVASSVAPALFKLSRIIARTTCPDSLERYRTLLAAQFMANAIDDREGGVWVASRAEYLRQRLFVAQGLKVRALGDGLQFADEERVVMECLPFMYGCDNLTVLTDILNGSPERSEPRRIAELLLARQLSESLPDEIKLSGPDLRAKLCDLLDVADAYSEGNHRTDGKYGKVETGNVEFKSSYVMRNDGRGADIDFQGRGQVFEAVCGFLNKDGGRVYVGVNDSGDPILAADYGLKGDIAWFDANFDTLKAKRYHQLGRSVTQPKDLDSYARFLNDERDLYFKPSVRSLITITPTDDHDAIRIDVEPSLYEVAFLYSDNTWSDGCAYVRDGGSTRAMPRDQQEKRLMNLRSVGKMEKDILTLTEAIDKKHKVIFKDYKSGNSRMVSDRLVVPVNLACNNENVWCYDIDAKKLKEFRIIRIGEIVTDIENPGYPHNFEEGRADVFRWINPEVDVHVKMRLSLQAYNCLLEEYTNARMLPQEELHQVSTSKWELDTHLHGWGAAVRFYVGLAKDIEILESRDSEQFVVEIEKYLMESGLK